MNNLSSANKLNGMTLNAENIGKAIRAWIKNNPDKTEGECIEMLSKRTGISPRTLNSYKNYMGGEKDKPNPRLDNITALMAALNCKAEFFKRHDFD